MPISDLKLVKFVHQKNKQTNKHEIKSIIKKCIKTVTLSTVDVNKNNILENLNQLVLRLVMTAIYSRCEFLL